MPAWWDPQDQQAFDRYERVARTPVTVLSFVMVPVILLPLVVTFRGATAVAFDVADYVGWVLFSLDYCIRLTLVPQRSRFVRTYLFDLVIIVLWVIPLVSIPGASRLLRIAQIVRLASFLGSGLQRATGHRRRGDRVAVTPGPSGPG